MVRNLFYISPQFPTNYIEFIVRLKQFGINALGVASDHYHQLPQKLRDSIAEYYRVDDMNDYNQVLNAGRYFQNKYGSIDRVESHSEYWLPVEAALREDLGVWGKNKVDTATMRHKSLMKKKFVEAGLNVVRGEVMYGEKSAFEFTRSVGYPIVMKPDSGVGASFTYRIDNDQQLGEFLKHCQDRVYFMEEYVDGDIITFDGLTDHDGRMVYCNSLRYGDRLMEVVNENRHTYFMTSREIEPELEGAGRRLVKVFDVREKFFHFEFFKRRSDNALIALEVNIRPPGGTITDLWNYADDMDIYQEWARILYNNSFEAKWERRYHVAHISRKDHIYYRHSHQEVVSHCRERLIQSLRLPELFSRAMGNDVYIVRSEKLNEILAMAEFIHAQN